MIRTELCEQLGIQHPILSAGMGTIATAELAAAVSNSGACGVVGSAGASPSHLRKQIELARSLTDKPFGVNIILALPLADQFIEVCFQEQVPLVVFFWGDPARYVEDAHRRGVKVIVQVGSIQEAKSAAEAGVDAIIAQGFEAGGHVKGTVALSVLVPAVVETVDPLPVIASGGIATGRGIVAAICLGAQAVSMGTRFLCSAEAAAADSYKEQVLQSTAEDTVYTQIFDIEWSNAPHRVLRNKAFEEWQAAGQPAPGQRPGEGDSIGSMTLPSGRAAEVVRYSALWPMPDFTGDVDFAPLYAGQSCALVHEIKPAKEIVQELVDEAQKIITQLSKM